MIAAATPYSLNDIPAPQVVDAIVSGLRNRKDRTPLVQSLIVRMLNIAPPDMFGGEVVDTLPGADPNNRLSYDVSPFAKTLAGSLITAVAEDSGGQLHVLLGRRAADKPWEIPAGHMLVKQPNSTQGMYTQDLESRDDFERALSKNVRYTSAEPVQTLTPQAPEFDASLQETAKRELAEETGLRVNAADLVLVNNATQQAGGRQAIENIYLADTRKSEMERSEQGLPVVQPLDDLKELRWVKVKEITEGKDADGKPTYRVGAEELLTKHGNYISEALHLLREKEVNHSGVTLDRVKDFAAERRPNSEFGAEAMQWHREALNIAEAMKTRLESMRIEKTSSPGLSL